MVTCWNQTAEALQQVAEPQQEKVPVAQRREGVEPGRTLPGGADSQVQGFGTGWQPGRYRVIPMKTLGFLLDSVGTAGPNLE